MKTRNGFVSNSSSSSFVIATKHLTQEQIMKILNHMDYWNENFADLPDSGGKCDEEWVWDVAVLKDHVTGSTWMDNFSMYKFFEYIDVNDEYVKWSD